MKTPVTLLLAALIAAGAFSPSSAAAHEGATFDSFTVEGTLKDKCRLFNLSVSDPSHVRLDTRRKQRLGTLLYKCRNRNGMTRTITSENNGFMRSDDNHAAYRLAHTGKFGIGFGFRQLSEPLVSSVPGSIFLAIGLPGSVWFRLDENPDSLMAGTYRDRITISVAAN